LIGPPGTGKSQTIANLIAQCLAERKRVLFVSEKIAALDVVYRRLREVKLGEFCLELHSNKARKLDVLEQLKNAWEARGDIDPAIWRAEAARLKKLRDELNIYVERLHVRHANGMTLFEAIGRVVGGQEVPVLALSWGAANTHDLAAMDTLREVADRLEVNAHAVGWDALLTNPLVEIAHSDWSPGWQQSVMEAARQVIPAAQAVEQTRGQLTQALGLPSFLLNRRVRGAFAVLARVLPNAAGHDWRFALRADVRTVADRLQAGAALLAQHRALSAALSPPWPEAVVAASLRGLQLLQQRREIMAQLPLPWPADVVEELNKGLGLLDEILQTMQQLSVQYSEEVEQLSMNQIHRQWAKAEKRIWPFSWRDKGKLRKQMEAVALGEGELDAAKDIRLWAKIRALRAEASALEIGPLTEGIWSGLKTRSEFAQCALDFQQALESARRERAWEDAGFDAIADGRCGDRLAKALTQLRTLRALDAELKTLEFLSFATSGLWAGIKTRPERLQAALHFVAALSDVRESGMPQGEYEAVARGDCGPALAEDLQRLRQRAGLERQLADYDDLREITAGLWHGLKTRTDELEQALKFQTLVSTAIANLASTPEQIDAIKMPLERLIGEGNALLAPNGPIGEAGAAYVRAWNALQPAIDRLAAAGSFSNASKSGFNDMPVDELAERCAAIVRSESKLRTWCAWLKAREQAGTLGLTPLVEAIENNRIAQGTVRQVFETNYSRWWLNAAVDEEPVILNFVSVEHEKRIADFRALDDRFTELSRACIRAGLCAELPLQEDVTRNSEWGVLRYEMSKKKRHMPLRELMTRIPTALLRLTPCLLMSPLSIAQYLAADATRFDVVVFDEASQIPVWDAIGAIARGKQVVMVGDPKQLPPTNFFDRAESDADDDDVEGDLESILDECRGANLPEMSLNWHYRSRSESLIAFSNHRYYGGGLVTFPSPTTEDRAVSFHHVQGVYEKGGARINKPEAKTLVADLVARLKSPGFQQAKLTIGVVTFNSEQQSLIEDLLDEERRKDPSIEPYFAEVELEPVFVKNLESVQGDERDIMYFSITYGPDLHGAVSMNFGPLNRDGGGRRLNVAITRARHELRVFASLKPEQMDLARTQANGVRDLKHFLEFAERGPRALAEATHSSQQDFDSPFEAAVAAALGRKGWALHTQVGASAFRIDLAVVDPDAPGSYLTGIECDGATYHRSATARDRDKLREQVLRGLGWEILRVWSTDWWIDPQGTLDKLDARLKALLETRRARRAEAAEREALRLAAEALAKAVENPVPDAPPPSATDADAPDVRQAVIDGGTVSDDGLPSAETYAKNLAEPSPLSAAVFVEADPASVVEYVDPAAFFDASYSPSLARMIAHVVEVEGPVLDVVLARRIARAHDWQKTGSRIRERVDALAAQNHAATHEEVGKFYWPAGKGLELPVPFRRAADEAARTVDEICMPELAALAREVAESGKTGEAAIVAMARALGMRKLGAASRRRLEQAAGLLDGPGLGGEGG
jgi:very-short-patch-repair endonuclease